MKIIFFQLKLGSEHLKKIGLLLSFCDFKLSVKYLEPSSLSPSQGTDVGGRCLVVAHLCQHPSRNQSHPPPPWMPKIWSQRHPWATRSDKTPAQAAPEPPDPFRAPSRAATSFHQVKCRNPHPVRVPLIYDFTLRRGPEFLDGSCCLMHLAL